MIDGYEDFTYIGYTESKGNHGSPTLYFKEGRYTQVHNNKKNIGWHPCSTDASVYRGANITPTAHSESSLARKNEDTEPKKQIKEAFLRGELDSELADAKFFEVFKVGKGNPEDGSSWSGHPSRARRLMVGFPDFNENYSEAYAKGILAKTESKLAENEQPK